MQKRLFVCQGPTQLLNILSSLLYDKDANDVIYEDFLLFSGTCINPESNLLTESMLSLAGIWHWYKIINLAEHEQLLSSLYIKSKDETFKHVYNLVGCENFDIVYSVRNWQVSNEIVLNSYKKAYHICYGDAFGEIDYIFSEQFVQYNEVRQITPIYHNNFSYTVSKKKYNIKTVTIDKKYLQQAIELYIEKNRDILPKFEIDQPNMQPKSRTLLLLTSSLSESRHISLDNDLLLYNKIFERIIDSYKQVFVKPHPRESESKMQMFKDTVKKNYNIDITFLKNSYFNYLPVEIFYNFFKFSKVYSVLSSSVRHLRFLYNANAECALTESDLDLFYKENRDHIKEALKIETELDRLTYNWHGNGYILDRDNQSHYPSRPDVYWNKKGENELKINNFDKALNCFKNAIAYKSEYCEPYNNLGIVYLYMGDYNNSCINLKKAQEINPLDPDITINIADFYLLKKDTNLAEHELILYLDKQDLNKMVLNKLLEININARPELVQKTSQLNISSNNCLSFFDELPEEALFCISPEGVFVKEIMLSPVGKFIRKLYPKLNPVCKEFPQSHLVVLSDATITTCCQDALGENCFADLKNEDLGEIFENKIHHNLDLYEFKLCQKCLGGKYSLVSRREEREKMIDIWPDGLTIEIMGACNYRCCIATDIHKYRTTTPDLNLIFDKISPYLDKIRRLRLFNYGEPLLHKCFIDFIERIRANFPKIVLLLSTNGLLMDEKTSKAFVELRLDQIIVSVHGGPGTENMLKYSKINADYDKVISNVQKLIEMKKMHNSDYPKISLRAILFNWNDKEEDLERFRRDAKKLGLLATYGNSDTNNYHWLLDGNTGKGLNASKIFIPGSGKLNELIELKELFLPEKWDELILYSPVTNGSVEYVREVSPLQISEIYRKKLGIDVNKYFSGIEKISIYKCKDSGYQFFYPFNISGDSEFYTQLEKFPWYYMEEKWEFNKALELIKSTDKVLEIGSGRGGFIKKMLEKGISDCTGIELNASAVQQAQADRFPVIRQQLCEHKKNNSGCYDVVCAFQVLEHVSDVREFIKDCTALLKDGGKLIFSVPNHSSFLQYDEQNPLDMPPHHLGLWTEDSLKKIAPLFNLNIIDLYTEPLADYHHNYYLDVMSRVVKPDEFVLLSKQLQTSSANIKGHTVMVVYEKKKKAIVTLIAPIMLNLGCGNRWHEKWQNFDFVSKSPQVKACNLNQGIPAESNSVDVVYHSHLLEHFAKTAAENFIRECSRVLKPGGIIRIAVPDLEKIAEEYLKNLNSAIKGDVSASEKYDWTMLELYDQTVRNVSGGEMLKHWLKDPLPQKEYIIDRMGSEVKNVLNNISKNRAVYLNKPVEDSLTDEQIGKFRRGGEVHQWMYDRFSLGRLLTAAGFKNVRVCQANESAIPDFNSYLLDIEADGTVRKPDSLFIEAVK